MSDAMPIEPPFNGQEVTKLDTKTRFSLPVRWRAALGETFAFGYDPSAHGLIAVPFSVCEAFMKAHGDLMELVAPALDYGHLGNDGRIQIPPKYRHAFAAIGSSPPEIILEGKGRYIEMRPERAALASSSPSEAEKVQSQCVEVFKEYLDL